MRKNNAKKDKSKNTDGSMSVSGHLKELRNRILVCVILLFVAFGVCLTFAPLGQKLKRVIFICKLF